MSKSRAFLALLFVAALARPSLAADDPVLEDGVIIILKAEHVLRSDCLDQSSVLYVVTSEKTFQDLVSKVEESVRPPMVEIEDTELRIRVRAAAKRRVYGRTQTGQTVIFISTWDIHGWY